MNCPLMEEYKMKDNIPDSSTLNVLLLEDSVRDCEIIQEQLIDAGYTLNIIRVETEANFESSLQNREYDIILADFKLPGFDAFGALLLSNAVCPDVPFICVSGSIGEETAIELIKQGAADYVLKDRLARLPYAINRALEGAREKEAQRQVEEALKEKMIELQRFHDLTVGRELAMIELKKEVNELLKKLGQDEKYKIVD
jgi:DNA-binding NtrC family response regulator